jgi:hypothetical protein
MSAAKVTELRQMCVLQLQSRRPTGQVTSNRYFKAKMFGMLSRLAISRSPLPYEYSLRGKMANSLGLVAGNRDGKTKRISRLPALLAILDRYERLPSENFGWRVTFDIRLSLTG